jgi:hypothetical protein
MKRLIDAIQRAVAPKAEELLWPGSSHDRARDQVDSRRLRRLLDEGWDDLGVEVTARPLGLGMLQS